MLWSVALFLFRVLFFSKAMWSMPVKETPSNLMLWLMNVRSSAIVSYLFLNSNFKKEHVFHPLNLLWWDKFSVNLAEHQYTCGSVKYGSLKHSWCFHAVLVLYNYVLCSIFWHWYLWCRQIEQVSVKYTSGYVILIEYNICFFLTFGSKFDPFSKIFVPPSPFAMLTT